MKCHTSGILFHAAAGIVCLVLLSGAVPASAWKSALFGQWVLVSKVDYGDKCSPKFVPVSNRTWSVYTFLPNGHVFYVDELDRKAFAGTWTLEKHTLSTRVSAGVGFQYGDMIESEVSVGGKDMDVLTRIRVREDGTSFVAVYYKVDDFDPETNIPESVDGEWTLIRTKNLKTGEVVKATKETQSFLCFSPMMYSTEIFQDEIGFAGTTSTIGATLVTHIAASTHPMDVGSMVTQKFKAAAGKLVIHRKNDKGQNVEWLYWRWK